MAWAERLTSGKYRGGWRTPDGTKHYTRRETHPEHPYARIRDAREAAQEAEVGARRQASATKGAISASTVWGDWWDLITPSYPESDTGATVAGIVSKYLRPKWETVPLNKIFQVDAKAWVADLLPGREASYVRRICAVFRWSLNQAVDRGVLTGSPWVGIRIPKAPKRAKAYTDDAFLAAISPHLAQWYQDLNDLAAETGLRPGELCGLHADVVDREDGWLTVSKVLVGKRKVIRHEPKDKDSREVPLTDKALAIIERNLADRDLTAGCGVPHTNGKPCRSVLVIRNSRGGVIAPKVWRNMIAYAAGQAKIELRGRGPYAGRRAFFTRAARGGMDAFELAAIGGHADVKQTQDYVQQTPAARDRLRAALGETTRLTVVPSLGQVGAEVGQTSASVPHEAPREQGGGKGG